LYSQGVDTLEEIENLNIKFVATDAGQPGGVSFDYIWIQIDPDVTPPDYITTLSAQTGTNSGEIDLSWTAPGDDGNTGDITNGQYHIKYSSTSTDTWEDMPYEIQWSTDTSPGNSENKTIGSLIEGIVYYFYIKTADEMSNWSDLSNKVNAVSKQDSTLSIFIGSSSYDFGAVIKGSTTTANSSITVTNNGTVNERYSLHLTAPAGWACVTDTVPGAEEFRMCGNFQTATAQSSHFDIGGSFSDAIGTIQRLCSTGDFGKDDEGEGVKGYNVPPTQDRYLWFRFEAPTSTSLTIQQTITVTITAEEQP
ncbi:fibronectin type III domain-containing protein, partial [bacterium]|nr:fibronectin type III domain-containing protein [bacterium]